MKKILISCVFLFLFYTNVFASCSSSCFLWPDFSKTTLYPNEYTGLIYIDFAIKQEIMGEITTGGTGFSIDMGFNLGRFLHKALALGPFIGISPTWGTKYNDTFLSDYRKNYDPPRLNTGKQIDDLSNTMAKIQGDYVNDGEIMGSGFSFYYGLLFKLPIKYSPPIKIYKLLYWSNTKEASGGGGITYTYSDGTSGSSPKIFSLDRYGWGLEFILFRGYTYSGEGSWLGNINLGYVSLFFEFFDFGKTKLFSDDNDNADMRDVYLNEFTKDEFDKKYQSELKMGMKVGFNLM